MFVYCKIWKITINSANLIQCLDVAISAISPVECCNYRQGVCTPRKESLLSLATVMFSQACIKNSVHEGGCTPPLGRHPQGRYPP